MSTTVDIPQTRIDMWREDPVTRLVVAQMRKRLQQLLESSSGNLRAGNDHIARAQAGGEQQVREVLELMLNMRGSEE